MAFDFSTLVTDRSPEDLQALRDLLATPMADWTAEQLAEFNRAASKGAYNYTDLNRVTACMDYLNEVLTGLGYVTGFQKIVVNPEPEPVVPLPAGYTELEYVEGDGDSYINTLYFPSNLTRVVCDFQLTVDNGAHEVIFGARAANSTNAFVLGYTGHSNKNWRADFGYSQQSFPAEVTATGRHTADMDGRTCTIDDSQTVQSPQQTFTSDFPLFVFGNNSGGTLNGCAPARVFSCLIYENGALTHRYYPCKSPSGEVGLYDVVDNTFLSNSGTGTFSAGPDVVYPEPGPDPYTWYEEDIPTTTQMQRYLSNVAALRGALELPEDTVALPADLTGMTQSEANAIEGVLGIIQGWLQNMAAAWFYAGDLYAGEV